jgi:UDPglucose 6-dehydrogenase
MKIAVVGTGYVGLVTGVALSEIGHFVTCIDVDEKKVEKMRAGFSPIYEPGLDELMIKNIDAGRLRFTTNHQEGFSEVAAIYIAVGTPQKEDGTADLRFIKEVVNAIATHVTSKVVVVTKSTVPVGTNDYIRELLACKMNVPFDVVSNPEFLREGSAVHDTFHGDRIVIGSDNKESGDLIEEINKPFGIPVYRTDIRSAEMIKYASNAFLATKISFINEVANLCTLLNANVNDVAEGMGLDKRIGNQFLNAGIGYGGSCFPKDTAALVQIADGVGYDFRLMKEVIDMNKRQQGLLVKEAKERFGSLQGKKFAILGLSFKPNTDDMREAPSIVITRELILAGARVIAYDPIAMENAKRILPEAVEYVDSAEDALKDADAAFLLTEWKEISSIELDTYKEYLREPILFDGRNCYDLDKAKRSGIEYYSIGRPAQLRELELV